MIGSSDWPLIIFTVLMQLGVGMSLFAGSCRTNSCKDVSAEKSHFDLIIADKRLLWLIILVISGISLVASIFHLGRPFGSYLAFSNLGVAWLSLEVLIFPIYCGFALLTMLIANKREILGLITAIIGIVGIMVQGYTYAESALPAIDNAFPLIIFMLSTIVMGAAFFSRYNLLSGSLGALLAVMLTVPCVWSSGSPIMKLTAQMWLMSTYYWIGMVLLLIALLLAIKRKSPLLLTGLIVLAIFCLRVTFFAETPHSWLLMGMPN